MAYLNFDFSLVPFSISAFIAYWEKMQDLAYYLDILQMKWPKSTFYMHQEISHSQQSFTGSVNRKTKLTWNVQNDNTMEMLAQFSWNCTPDSLSLLSSGARCYKETSLSCSLILILSHLLLCFHVFHKLETLNPFLHFLEICATGVYGFPCRKG